MVEYDEASHLFAESKLTNLVHQIDAALAEDFPNPDIKSAAEKVRENIQAAIEKNRIASQYSAAIKEQALLSISNELANNSQLLGILLRANATRNPFELYYPFRKIARQFFANGDVFLILSSEWDYVPLTYPSNLEELPNYIIIAMPAPEADNVLAFPAAAHELGHSIWFRRKIREVLSDDALNRTVEYLDGKAGALPTMFPGYTLEQFTSDLIAKGLREQAISDVLEAAMRQLEEVFCDFVGLRIFGASYLHAFRYLLAPTSPGSRSSEYPDLCDRAEIISERASEEGFGSHDLQRWFAREENIEEEYASKCCQISDKVREALLPQVKNIVDKVMDDANFPKPAAENTMLARKRFSSGVPVEAGVSLGELICAAWELYLEESNGKPGEVERRGRQLSDLVLKSAEAIEYRARVVVAS